MQYPIIVKNYQAPAVNESEILRYAGAKGSNEYSSLISECLSECLDKLSYRLCYAVYPIIVTDDSVNLTFTTVKSKALAKNLLASEKAVVFTATIGVEIDRLIAQYAQLSPVKALVFQAIGAERVESLCNEFCKNLKNQYPSITPRFSAGYGDLPLSIQKDILYNLSAYKNVGVTLSESLIMLPSKSVTAIVGVADIKVECNDEKLKNGCIGCLNESCEFKR